MSKAAKQIILILVIMFIAALGFAGYIATQKQSIETAKDTLERELKQFEKRERDFILKNKELKAKVAEIEEAKAGLEKRMQRFEGVDLDEMEARIGKLTQERNEWKERVDKMKGERDELAAKLKAQPPADNTDWQSIVDKLKAERDNLVAKLQEKAEAPSSYAAQPASTPEASEESYWAGVLKQKVALELELENLKKNVTESSVEVVELKKKNSDLQLELSKIKNEKETIEHEIKYGNDLADSLSLELARSKNDNKFLNDRFKKINDENFNLREQIKQLTSTKIALEKSVVRLQDEKKEVQKKLLQTENVIQSRIDEIWEIKDSLQKDFKSVKVSDTGEIELPPIVVSSDQHSDETHSVAAPEGGDDTAQPAAHQDQAQEKSGKPGFNGNIVSVNDENNFVIVDIGQTDGLSLGDKLNVYRGIDYIAGLEVIQLRSDIAAADIRNKIAPIKVGDIVR